MQVLENLIGNAIKFSSTGGEKSTGLGLAISRQLIHLHDGEIGAYNNPSGGCTFWFRLPIA